MLENYKKHIIKFGKVDLILFFKYFNPSKAQGVIVGGKRIKKRDRGND